MARLVLRALLASFALRAQVLTSQYDNARTGANTRETTLTPANVNSKQFGKVFSLRVDGDVYAQPLYVPNVPIPGQGTHNVLYVATEHDSVYAFDADGRTAEPLWHVSFLKPGVGTVDASDVGCFFIDPEIGITPTPVIDLASGTLYVLARTKESEGLLKGSAFVQRLHALAITTGAEKFGGPVAIDGKAFNTRRELPRAALLLASNQVYLTWASSCDEGPYHGWVMAYDARTLRQTAVFNTSPDDSQSGIWQADMGPAADESGAVYVATGNGTFDVASGGRDYGDSLLKLRVEGNQLVVRDYFTPPNEKLLASKDLDLGSGGPMLLPGHFVLIAGKGGTLYLIDRNRMRTELQFYNLAGDAYSAPAYWNGHVFFLPSHRYLEDFIFRNGRLSDHGAGTRKFDNPGATPAVSANGNTNGVVWLIETRTWNGADKPSILHAFDASDVARELYNSEENGARDGAGLTVRFTVPTVVNGRVYVGAKKEVDVYGPLHQTSAHSVR
jgi:hypothetical protein